jgi:hypothetical protein
MNNWNGRCEISYVVFKSKIYAMSAVGIFDVMCNKFSTEQNKLNKKLTRKLMARRDTRFHAEFLLGLFFDPEDEGHMFLRNVG